MDRGGGGVELLLEVLEAAKGLVNGILERAGSKFAAIPLPLRGSRSEVVPEERVVNVS